MANERRIYWAIYDGKTLNFGNGNVIEFDKAEDERNLERLDSPPIISHRYDPQKKDFVKKPETEIEAIVISSSKANVIVTAAKTGFHGKKKFEGYYTLFYVSPSLLPKENEPIPINQNINSKPIDTTTTLPKPEQPQEPPQPQRGPYWGEHGFNSDAKTDRFTVKVGKVSIPLSKLKQMGTLPAIKVTKEEVEQRAQRRYGESVLIARSTAKGRNAHYQFYVLADQNGAMNKTLDMIVRGE